MPMAPHPKRLEEQEAVRRGDPERVRGPEGQARIRVRDTSAPQVILFRQMVHATLWQGNKQLLDALELASADERRFKIARGQFMDVMNAVARNVSEAALEMLSLPDELAHEMLRASAVERTGTDEETGNGAGRSD
jgi:hypothetical protein